MAFDAHRLVDEQADAFGEAGVALLSQELQDVVQEFRLCQPVDFFSLIGSI
jgi:hypothetical protein